MSELGSVFSRGAQSLRVTGKRKGLVVKESIHWDSVSSVSSVSELSECPTTGTDETGEQDHDRGNLSPVPLEPPSFTVGSVETTISSVSMNGSVPNGSGCPIPTVLLPETPFSSLNTEDSGINMTDPFSDSWQVSGSHGNQGEKWDGSKCLDVLFFTMPPILSPFQVMRGVWQGRPSRRK